MTDDPRFPRTRPPLTRPHAPRLLVDTGVVSDRYRAVLAAAGDGFRTALVQAVADIPALVSEVERLYVLVLECRRRYADLAAAARAALAADAEGEPDPLAYLRDELAHPSGGR